MVLKASQIFPATPTREPGKRTEKSPDCIARRTSSNSFRLSSEPLSDALAPCPFCLFRRAAVAFTSMTGLHADSAKCTKCSGKHPRVNLGKRNEKSPLSGSATTGRLVIFTRKSAPSRAPQYVRWQQCSSHRNVHRTAPSVASHRPSHRTVRRIATKSPARRRGPKERNRPYNQG